jgi:DNA-binding LacI/PurR family transcriptional regulator
MKKNDDNNITIYDIARESGVSVSTVSRILNGTAQVRPEKRERVQEVIDKYNFQPNLLARSLVSKESKMIGCILPDITSDFFSSLFSEIEKNVYKLGYNLILCNTMNDSEIESSSLNALLEKQVDAIIFMGGRINSIRTRKKFVDEFKNVNKRGIPLVFINGDMKGVEAYRVNTDEIKGIEKLVDYIISLGHEKIGLLGGEKGITAYEIKLKAIKKALRKYKIELRDEWVIDAESCGSFSMESGVECAKKILKLQERPTVLIGINDFVTIGIISALKMNNLSVPDDISVVGFDNIKMSQFITPKLTTVNQNYQEIGEKVASILSRALKKEEVEVETMIHTDLIIRESCKAITA